MPRNNRQADRGYRTWLHTRHKLRGRLDSTSTFEVRVVVAANGSLHYSSHIREWIKETSVALFHVCARTAEQACEKAEKYGRPIGARKIERDKIFGDIEALKLNQAPLVDVYAKGSPYKGSAVYANGDPYKNADVYAEGNPYNSALAMDEMIWQKRNERRKNQEKDKNPLDI